MRTSPSAHNPAATRLGEMVDFLIRLEDDPAAQWLARFDLWKQMIQRFRTAEEKHLHREAQLDSEDELFHRLALCRLIGEGGELGLELLADERMTPDQKRQLRERLQTHLECLLTDLAVWHGAPPAPAITETLDRIYGA
ncbi:MAG: hypothetical protein HY360_02170 [Verrucomicrobia bacterium]|nr:hypothetical protein [Verrucomicrobiota bacterium]